MYSLYYLDFSRMVSPDHDGGAQLCADVALLAKFFDDYVSCTYSSFF